MARLSILTVLVMAGCTGSLGVYDRGPLDNEVTGSAGTGTGTGAVTGTGTGAVTGTGTGAPTGTGTGAPTGTGTGAPTGTGTGAPTGSGTGGGWGTSGTTGTGTGGGTGTGTGGGTTLPPAALVDGTYVGTIRIDYENLIPFFGGVSHCDGDVTLIVDQAAVPQVTGVISNCEWPPLALWVALLGIGEAAGTLDGNQPGYGQLNGWTMGEDTSYTFVWDDPWVGVVTTGPTIVGGFAGNNFLQDNYSGLFSAVWVGP